MPGSIHLFPSAHEWGNIFFPAIPWAEKIARPFIVYLFLLAAFRISGKRELGQATLFDFLIILIISNVVQNAIIGNDNSVLGSFAGVVTLLMMSFTLNRATSRSKHVRQVLEGMPALLVHNGKILDEPMQRESVSYNDLFMALRQEGIASLDEVRYAILELNGKISIIRSDAPRPEANNSCITAEILRVAGVSDSETPHPDVA